MRIHTVTAGLLALGLAVGSGPATTAARGADKSAEILTGARKAIGDKKLDGLKSLSVNATLQRNVGNMQINSDVELLVELPDKYVRSETTTGPVSGSNATGFNGDKPLARANSPMVGGGGGMIIRMGPGGGAFTGSDAKPTPEEQEKMNAAMLRSSRQELSRLMLGWFAMAHPSTNAEYSYAGEAESPDGKAYVIDAKNADGFAARLFIDQQTQLPLMLTYQGPQPRMITMGGPGGAAGGRQGAPAGGQTRQMTDEERTKMREDMQKRMADLEKDPPKMVEYTIYFDDWREVDGVKFPHSMRRASGGTTSEEWTITKVKVNPKIDAKKFAIES